ncbi:MAG TPA: hypothetical protein VHO06_17995 [Polyangia bacterium]|nr:hypothetical protein [Polyangia bacterium]
MSSETVACGSVTLNVPGPAIVDPDELWMVYVTWLIVAPLGSTTASFRPPLLGLLLFEQFTPIAPPRSATAPKAASFTEFRVITVSSRKISTGLLGARSRFGANAARSPSNSRAADGDLGPPAESAVISNTRGGVAKAPVRRRAARPSGNRKPAYESRNGNPDPKIGRPQSIFGDGETRAARPLGGAGGSSAEKPMQTEWFAR